jgi:transcriptional regulator with XRE-family HTH domain
MSTRIREFRKLRGMTLQFLAHKVGTTAQTIQRLETGNMTVSLDWLQRIAEVFGMPAAALLVTDQTASVLVIGELDASGQITPLAGEAQKTLSLVVAIPHPIAVRVSTAVGAFEADTILICNKFEFDPDVLIEGRLCLVGLKIGRIVFGRVSTSSAGVSLDEGSSSMPTSDIEWLAPVTMAIRYFE